jgi:hypothetical protein
MGVPVKHQRLTAVIAAHERDALVFLFFICCASSKVIFNIRKKKKKFKKDTLFT